MLDRRQQRPPAGIGLRHWECVVVGASGPSVVSGSRARDGPHFLRVRIPNDGMKMKKSLLLSGGTAGVALVEKKDVQVDFYFIFFLKKGNFHFFLSSVKRERRYVCCFSILADEGGEDAKFNFFFCLFF